MYRTGIFDNWIFELHHRLGGIGQIFVVDGESADKTESENQIFVVNNISSRIL